MVRDEILEALQQNGYRKPSPVQSQAIPMALLGMGLFSFFLTKLTFFCRYVGSVQDRHRKNLGIPVFCKFIKNISLFKRNL
jgi:hypothetical protein